jgi:hypothetical protein
LRDAQLRRGLGEVQRFTYGQEVSEMPQFHRCLHYNQKAWLRKEHGIGPAEESEGSCCV